MLLNKNNSSSTSKRGNAAKREARREAKKEAKKEVRKEMRKVSPGKAKRKQQQKTPHVRTTVVGTGVIAENPMYVPYRIKQSSDGKSAVISTRDYVGTITIPANAVVGQCILSLPLSPLNFAATRLSVQAGLWEKFQLSNWDFECITTQGTTTSGQVLAFVDPDISDLWVEGQVYNLNRGAVQWRSQPFNLWENTLVRSNPDASKGQWFYCNISTSTAERWAYPGQFVVLYAGGATTLPLTTHNIYMRVRLNFANPELDNSTGNETKPVRIYATTIAPTANTIDPIQGSGTTLTTPGFSVDPTNGTLFVNTNQFPNSDLYVTITTTAQNNAGQAIEMIFNTLGNQITLLSTGVIKLAASGLAGYISRIAARYLIPASVGPVTLTPTIAGIGAAGAAYVALSETQLLIEGAPAGSNIDELFSTCTIPKYHGQLAAVDLNGVNYFTDGSNLTATSLTNYALDELMFKFVGNGIVSGTLAQPGFFRVTLKFVGTAYFQWNFQSTFTSTQIGLSTDSNSTMNYLAGGGPGSTYLFVVVSTTVLTSTVLTFTGFDGTTLIAPNTIRLNLWVTQAAPITFKSLDSHVQSESEGEEDNWERLCEVPPSALRIPESRPLVLPAAKVPSRSLSDKSIRKGC
jgi:hypothetical protein